MKVSELPSRIHSDTVCTDCTYLVTGTAIHLYGIADRSSFSISLDETETPTQFNAARQPDNLSDPATQVLASFTGLAQADHILSLTAHFTNTANGSDIEGLLIFDRAVITASTGLVG